MNTLVIEKKSGSPAKTQLLEYIRQGIDNGRFRPGDRLPTTKEFVNAAGVSSNTVRQAMADLIRDGELKAVPGMGTFVVDKRQQEIDSRTNLKRVAILPIFHQTNITALEDSYRAESIRGFLEECERSGAVGSVLPGELIRRDDPEDVRKIISSANCQGLIWLYPEPSEWKIIDYLSSYDFPIVVTRRSNIDSDVAFVGADYEKAGFDSGRRFIQSGCDNVLLFNHFSQPRYLESQRYCGWPIGIKQGLSRAFESLLDDASERVKQFYLQGFTENQNEIVFDAIEKSDRNTAILFTNNYHLYNVFLSNPDKAKSLLLGRKVAVIGNRSFLVNLAPFVRDIDLDVLVDPFREITQCAAQKLLSLIDGYLARTTTLVNIEIKKVNELDLLKYTGI
ncbi:MAG: GntR family transcriptional regulator [Sedimentisphaeraceae bacterium JB056]